MQVRDEIPPRIASAVFNEHQQIAVTFTEELARGGSDPSWWSLSGPDSAGLNITSATAPNGTSDFILLRLSHVLNYTNPEFSLAYARPTDGGLGDGLNLLEGQSVQVQDGVPPRIVSAAIGADRQVTVTFTEQMAQGESSPAWWSLSGPDSAGLTIESVLGPDGTDAMNLIITGADEDTGLDIFLEYSRPTTGGLGDGLNLLEGQSVQVRDEIPPRIASAVLNEHQQIAVTFTEELVRGQSDPSWWSLSGPESAGLTIESVSGPSGRDFLSMRISGTLNSTDPKIYLTYTMPLSGGLGDGTNLHGAATVQITDGIPPQLRSISAVPLDQVVLTFSETVDTDTTDAEGWFLVHDDGSVTAPIRNTDPEGNSDTMTLTVPVKTSIETVYAAFYRSYAGTTHDEAGNPLEDIPNPLASDSDRSESTSDSDRRRLPPIIDLNAARYHDFVTLPADYAQKIVTFDKFEPLYPYDDDLFDFPISINGSGYLLGGTLNTLSLQAVKTGASTDIVFTVYDRSEIVHFTIYMNMRGNNVDYSRSDTYVTFDRGSTRITDPYDLIADALVTITTSPERRDVKLVNIAIQFQDMMGPTNVAIKTWNMHFKSTNVQIINAFTVGDVESWELQAVPEPSRSDNPDPEPGIPSTSGTADPQTRQHSDQISEPSRSENPDPEPEVPGASGTADPQTRQHASIGQDSVRDNGSQQPVPTESQNKVECLVAIASYGTETTSQIHTLLDVLDDKALDTITGTLFMTGFSQACNLFYMTVVDMERDITILPEAVHILLTPMLVTLQIMSLAEEDADVRTELLWITVLALNIAIYIGAPSVAIMLFKRSRKI